MRGLRRSPLPRRAGERGFILIALLVLLTMGSLYFLISNLTPEAIEARRQAKTEDALIQAREALLGYALKYRDEEAGQGRPDRMYGYLPLPDMGSSRNQNTDPNCKDASNNPLEGCDANTPTGISCDANNIYPTMVGRFPWRTLGTGPLRDGHSECLWLIVSSLHLRKQCSNPALPPMNWDTLGQLDIVTANGTSALTSALAVHDRPVAIIFSPGPPLPGQDRSDLGGNDVSQCGGNYIAANYLDPATAKAAALGGITNYLAGTNNASGLTGDSDTTNDPDDALKKSMLVQGKVFKSGSNYLPGGCAGLDCELLANDTGLAITSDLLFGAIRKSAYFRTDINAMLDRMTTCLRDQVAAGPGFTPDPLAGFTPPGDKYVGRIPANTCYDDTQNPVGYFSHYRDQVFVASRKATDFTVTVDGVPSTCPAAVIFGSQRGAGQSRSTTVERNTPANYLEGANLAGFITSGVLGFTGPSVFAQVSATQAASQDIVRCVPAGASLTVVAPTVAASAGNIQLAGYAPATGLLTLGSAAINSNYGAAAAALYACAWTPEVHESGSGFRSYFRFRVRRVGEGFTFAVIDGDRNGVNACGAARQHLGYSGDNGNASTPYIQWPKLAIELDTSRQANFSEAGNPLSNGRNDPCYTSGCGGQGLDNSSHVAVVYWGYGAADPTIPVTQHLQDDNVHGFPWPPDTSARPAPRNPYPVLPYVAPPAYPDPTPAPGVAPLDRMGVTDASQREFHARLEVTRGFTAPTDAKNGVTSVQVQFWIEPQAAASISAMTYNAGSPPTLSITTATSTGVNTGFDTGDTLVIKDAVPPGFNGEYAITRIDATHFTATLPSGTADPGHYISAITWTKFSGFTDQATVTSPNHGLSTGNSITIAGAIPTEYNGTYTITRIDANTYQFGLELAYEPGNLVPAIAAAKALTPHAVALANTTRPMSQLDATFKPLVSDSATIYDEQMIASSCDVNTPCPNGQSCGSDSMCYRPSFRNLRLGFTVAERPTISTTTARGQLIEIKDRATTWLP